jgi:membrane protease YdiL (CAAX protease family)
MKARRISLTTKWLLVLFMVVVLLPYVVASEDKSNLNDQFIQAVKDGQLDKVKALLAKGANVNTSDKDGLTPLMHAADQGNMEAAKVLIEKGGYVDAKSQEGATALMFAVQSGHLDMVKLLLANGADVNEEQKCPRTALQLAEQQDQSKIVELLKSHGAETDHNALVNVASIKLIVALFILWAIAFSSSEKKRPDHSDFFARHNWKLLNACTPLINAIAVIFAIRIIGPLSIGRTPNTGYEILWGCVSTVILGGYYGAIVRPYGTKLADFGIDKTHFFGSGALALNIVLVYFALSAAGVAIPLLNLLVTEPRLYTSWFDAVVICEELLFRGMLYAPAARLVGTWQAIVMLSIIECLSLHFNLNITESFIMIVIFVIFYVIYICTESLWTPLILHIGIYTPLWLPMSATGTPIPLPPDSLKYLYIFVASALLIVNLLWLWNYLSKRKHL